MSTHIRSREGNGYSELTRTVTWTTPVMAGRGVGGEAVIKEAMLGDEAGDTEPVRGEVAHVRRGEIRHLLLRQRDGQAGAQQLKQHGVPRSAREHDPVGGIALARGGDRDTILRLGDGRNGRVWPDGRAARRGQRDVRGGAAADVEDP